MWCVTERSLGLISSDVINVSFVKPLGIVMSAHSTTSLGVWAGTRNAGPRTTMSGLICHPATGGGNVCYVPGVQPDDYRPFHAAKLIPANSDITFAVHYTPTGKEVVDYPLIGFTLADRQPEKQWISFNISGAGPTFAIPPNDGNYLSPLAEAEFGADA